MSNVTISELALPHFEAIAGDLFTLNLSAAVAVGGELTYVEV